MEEEASIHSIVGSIAEASVIAILFPALRRSLVIDTRSDEEYSQMVRIMPQVASFEARIKSIEQLRPSLGKVRAILGVPWMRPLRELEDARIPDGLISRLVILGLAPDEAHRLVSDALKQLKRYEQIAFARLVSGHGYSTLWSSK